MRFRDELRIGVRRTITLRVAPTLRLLVPGTLLTAAAWVAAQREPDPTLLEAVDWYTGVAGAVDDTRARELLEEAAAGEGPLSVMWLARVHSTGRMGFPRDEERPRAMRGRARPWRA